MSHRVSDLSTPKPDMVTESPEADDTDITAITVPTQMLLFSVIGFCIYKAIKQYSGKFLRTFTNNDEDSKWETDSEDSNFGTIGDSHHHRQFHYLREKGGNSNPDFQQETDCQNR